MKFIPPILLSFLLCSCSDQVVVVISGTLMMLVKRITTSNSLSGAQAPCPVSSGSQVSLAERT